MTPQAILHFWFTELTPAQHFAKDAALDETIRSRFGAVLGRTSTPEELAFLQQPGSSF